MMWIGLVLGAVIGGLVWELQGAVTLGFIGWLAGVIVKSQRKPSTVAPAPVSTETLDARVARLERSVTALQAELARMGVAPAVPDAAAAPVVPDAVPAAVDPDAVPAAVDPDAVPAAVDPEVVPAAVVPEAAPAAMVRDPISPAPNPIVAWLTGGNTIARVGLLILFFGFAFLLKYAADNQMLPPELRVAGVGIGGIVLLVLGWRLRAKRPGYALGLQGAGVAVLYLTTFAAMRMYGLLPAEAAFVLLAAIAVFSAVLAILQDSPALAVIGAGGGFLAPVLASTGGGSHVTLFSYYLVLGLGIAVIAWYKAWRALNLTGFVFTLLIGAAWGARDYRPEHFASAELFLVAFWLLFTAIAVMVAREAATKNARYVDGTLVFGVPLAAFALQAGIMRPHEHGLAFSSLVAAAAYLLLAWRLMRTGRESWALLAQSFLALGVVFVTLAIPLALDARWTSASWALEGAAIVWIGLRQKRTIARAFGLLLQLAAGVAYVEGFRRMPGGWPLVDAAFVGAVIMALAGLWTHRLLLTAGEDVTRTERLMVAPFFAWGLAWALFAGIDEIDEHVPQPYEAGAMLLFLSGLAIMFGVLSRRWEWPHAAWAARALLPVLFLAAGAELLERRHPFGGLCGIGWAVAIATQVWILRAVEPDKRGAYTTFLHAGTLLLAAFIGAQELHWIAATEMARGTAWSVASVVVAPALLVLLASARAADDRWPIDEHPRAYRYNAALVIALAFAAWSLYANFTHDGRSDPLPYLPLVNALDLGHGLVALAMVAAWLALRRSGIAAPGILAGRGGAAIVGGLAFVWLNGVLLRTLSHWAGIPYTRHAMSHSVLAQASLSIFWALLALAAMVYATRTDRRALWMLGAGLMGVVVAKLFLVDLSNVGGIERIVSFIAVGVLMLLIGYFSPVPPRKAGGEAAVGADAEGEARAAP